MGPSKSRVSKNQAAKSSRKATEGAAGNFSSISVEELSSRFKTLLAENKGSPAELGSSLLKAKLKPILIVSCTQHVRVKRLVAWLRDNLFAGPQSFSFYFGNELSSAESVRGICSALSTPSLFSPSQLIVIYEANRIKGQAEKLLLEASAKADGRCLLLLATDNLNNKTGLIPSLASSATCCLVGELQATGLAKWIDKELQSSGLNCQIDPEARNILLETYGSNLSELSNELGKLALLSAGKTITRELVEELCLKTPEANSFELVRQLASGRQLEAQILAHEIILQGQHPLQLNSFLSKVLRTALANKERSPYEQGEAPHKEISNYWFIKQLGSASARISTNSLKRSIGVLADLDFRLKDSKLPPNLALSLALGKIR